jgi:type II secretory pathway component GspD/PulD (secretin)
LLNHFDIANSWGERTLSRFLTHFVVARGIAAALSLLLVLPLFNSSAIAADSAFVGILALAVDDAASKQLELSDETKAKLIELIDKREEEALGLALAIKDLPADQRAARLAPFVAESERQGLELLSDAQRTRLAQIQLASAGMSALADVKLAKQLELTDEQQAQIKTLIQQRAADLTQGGEDERRITHAKYERDLANVLTKEQRAAWEVLAGLAGGDQVAQVNQPAATDPAPKNPDDPPAPAEPQPEAPPKTDPQPAPEVKPTPEVKPPATGGTSRTQRGVPSAPAKPGEEVKLRFNFRYAPWKDVLDWFAEQDNLSLILDAPPPGTFNYTDSRSYTPAEAIDLLNSVLLTKGFTLVRRERMLFLVNLEDRIPQNLIAQISPTDLEKYGEFTLVTCVFQLSKWTPEEAEPEIRKLLGPQGNIIILSRAKQVLVTETAGKLRTIRAMIDAIENPDPFRDQKLTVMPLQHALPEEILVVARQLLGMPEGQNVMQDGSLRIAADTLGSRLMVTGKPDMVERFREILKELDQPVGTATVSGAPQESAQLETYPILKADKASVLAVMQTLLAGQPEVRLAIDNESGKLIALARPSDQRTIKATLAQLEGDLVDNAVIQLRRLDPQAAVLLIQKLFGTADGTKGPKVDADPITLQLLVRGTASEITQVKDLITKLEGDPVGAGEGVRTNLRVIPLTGRSAQSALEQVELFWPTMRTNKIRYVTPSAAVPATQGRDRFPGRVTPNGEPAPEPNEFNFQGPQEAPPAPKPAPPAAQPAAPVPVKAATLQRTPAGRVPVQFVRELRQLAQNQDAQPPEETAPKRPAGPPAEIIVSFTPTGIVIASDDLDALDDFEALLRTFTAGTATGAQEPTVFWLKYAKAEVAAALLQEILTGSAGDTGGGGGGSLIGDMASSMLGDVGGGLLGTLLGGGGGSGGGALTASGTFSVVPDPRLNALIVKANAADLDIIEQILQVIDQEASPEDVQTAGVPRLIPVIYSNAEEMSKMVQQVFASRVGGGTSQQQRQPSPEDFIQALRGGGGSRGSRSSQSRGEEQKMTIGVDQRSNSLIVTAPEPLYLQVKALVEQIDQPTSESSDDFRVVTIKRSNPEVVQKALSSILGTSVKTSTTTASGTASQSPSSGSSSGGDQSAASADQIRQRLEFFRALQGGGGAPSSGTPGGSRTGGSPFGGGGGSPFGGGSRGGPTSGSGGRPGGR